MKNSNSKYLLFISMIFIVIAANVSNAQKVGFINSEMIRDKFPEAKQSEQRVQSIVEEWKRELSSMQKLIENLNFEISKNRLIWSDAERLQKEKELQDSKENREAFARAKFEAGGEYDATLKQIMAPIEEKIYASVQEVASDEGYDIILDQSIQALPYVNFKYDMTIKVLRKLGVDVDQMEKELQDKIDKDPRNKSKDSKTPRTRSRKDNDPNAKPPIDDQKKPDEPGKSPFKKDLENQDPNIKPNAPIKPDFEPVIDSTGAPVIKPPR
jgi:outer membrane protein